MLMIMMMFAILYAICEMGGGSKLQLVLGAGTSDDRAQSREIRTGGQNGQRNCWNCETAAVP